jgi:hypothetical protein
LGIPAGCRSSARAWSTRPDGVEAQRDVDVAADFVAVAVGDTRWCAGLVRCCAVAVAVGLGRGLFDAAGVGDGADECVGDGWAEAVCCGSAAVGFDPPPDESAPAAATPAAADMPARARPMTVRFTIVADSIDRRVR